MRRFTLTALILTLLTACVIPRSHVKRVLDETQRSNQAIQSLADTIREFVETVRAIVIEALQAFRDDSKTREASTRDLTAMVLKLGGIAVGLLALWRYKRIADAIRHAILWALRLVRGRPERGCSGSSPS